jgi:hypothetical protein
LDHYFFFFSFERLFPFQMIEWRSQISNLIQLLWECQNWIFIFQEICFPHFSFLNVKINLFKYSITISYQKEEFTISIQKTLGKSGKVNHYGIFLPCFRISWFIKFSSIFEISSNNKKSILRQQHSLIFPQIIYSWHQNFNKFNNYLSVVIYNIHFILVGLSYHLNHHWL